MDILPRIKNYSLILAALILGANLVLLDFFFVKQKNDLLDFQTRLTQITQLNPQIQTVPSSPFIVSTPSASCPQSCLGIITNATKSAAIVPTAPVAKIQSTESLLATTVTTSSKEFFIPLGSGTLTQLNVWTDMNGVQGSFNLDNYSAVKGAFFEASLRLAGAGQVQARLYDTTTPAVFWDAQMSSTSTTGEYFSKPIKLFGGGNKTYRVQMNTTLSTAYIDQARIHLVTQ